MEHTNVHINLMCIIFILLKCTAIVFNFYMPICIAYICILLHTIIGVKTIFLMRTGLLNKHANHHYRNHLLQLLQVISETEGEGEPGPDGEAVKQGKDETEAVREEEKERETLKEEERER